MTSAIEGGSSTANGISPAKAPPAWLPTGMAVLGFAIIAWTMLRGAKRRGRSVRGQMEVSPRERLERLRESAERERVQDYASDAVELTQRLAAQLDAKAALLEELIARADERLSRLGDPTGSGTAARTDGPGWGPLASRDDGSVAPRGFGIEPGGTNTWGDGRTRDPGRVHENRRGFEDAFESERPDAMRREVFRLADAGLGADEIAQRTQQPIGQVRLILALRSA